MDRESHIIEMSWRKNLLCSTGEGKDEKSHYDHVISIRNSIWQKEEKCWVWARIGSGPGGSCGHQEEQRIQGAGSKRLTAKWKEARFTNFSRSHSNWAEGKITMWVIKKKCGLSKEGVENVYGVSHLTSLLVCLLEFF